MKQNLLSDEYLTDDGAEVDGASRCESQIIRRLDRAVLAALNFEMVPTISDIATLEVHANDLYS